MGAGSVYILHNRYLVGATGKPLLKIGGTGRSALIRALELSAATGVPGTFDVAYETRTQSWQRLEAMAHRALKQHRRCGEFFELDVGEAISCIERLKAKSVECHAPDSPDRISRPPGVRPSVGYSHAGTDVRFEPSDNGFIVVAEGTLLGHLRCDQRSVRYTLMSVTNMEEVLDTDILRLPRNDKAGLQSAAIREAKRRASWIATILKRFTTPVLQPLPSDEASMVRLNGLPFAIVTKRRQRRGLIHRYKEITYDLALVPCPQCPSLDDEFGARIAIKPRNPLSEWQMFVYRDSLGLEDSLRRYVLDCTRAWVSMSQARWSCRIEIPNCSVGIMLE